MPATFQPSDVAQFTITLGDRKPDSKVDVTVEGAVRLPMFGTQNLGPFTFTPPIEALFAAATSMAGAIPVPAVKDGLVVVINLARSALRH